MSQDSRASQPTSFLDALHPADDDTDLGWAPRRGPRHDTATSAAFGGVEVGPPVSRLAAPEEAPAPVEPAPVAAAPVATVPERCPSCGSRTRPEERWCSLCHTSLLPVPTLAPVVVPAQAAVRPTSVPAPAAPRVLEDEDGQLALDLETLGETLGETPGGAPGEGPGAPALDEAEVDRMLGALSREGGTGLRGLGSRRAKVLVAAGGATGLTALLLGGMAVLGSVLG